MFLGKAGFDLIFPKGIETDGAHESASQLLGKVTWPQIRQTGSQVGRVSLEELVSSGSACGHVTRGSVCILARG